MNSKILVFLVESLYNSFVLFFYTYVFMTLVAVDPFSFGFHPPTDLEKLSMIALIIFFGMLGLKSLASASNYANSEERTPKRIEYFPPLRH